MNPGAITYSQLVRDSARGIGNSREFEQSKPGEKHSSDSMRGEDGVVQ